MTHNGGERRWGVAISYLNIVVHAALGFIYVPILLHYIGKSEYGLYQLMGSLVAYFGVMDFGLTNAIVRFYAGYRAVRDQRHMENLLAVSLRLYGVIAVLLLAVGGVCYLLLDEIFGAAMTEQELASAGDLFLLLLFNVVITLVTMLFRAVLTAEERFLFLKGTELLQLVLQPVLVILILQEYPFALAVVAVHTLINCLLIGVRIYYCFFRLHIVIRFHGWEWDFLKEFRRLALTVFVAIIGDQLFLRTNQVILGIISGTEAVAVYSIAALIYMNYTALSTVISGVYLPHVSALVARRAPMADISALFIQIGRVQCYLLLLLLTGFTIFGREFIQAWAGADFLPAYGMTLLVIAPFTIGLIQDAGASILQAMNQFGFRAKGCIAIGAVNIVLAVPLGLQYGGMGCAFATGLCLLVWNGPVMNLYYARAVGLDIRSFWRQMGKILALGTACLAVGMAVNSQFESASLLALAGKMALYVLLYGACMWCLAMNDRERAFFRRDRNASSPD